VLSDVFFNWKNRLLSSAQFRSRSGKNLFGQWFARHYARRLFQLAGGFIHTQVFTTCLSLGVFDKLRAGPVTIDALAAECAVPLERFEHLLHAAAALDLVALRRRGRVGLGPLGAAMVENDGVAAFVQHHADLYRDLDDPVAFFRGERESSLRRLWSYASGDVDADTVEAYSQLMARSQSMVAEQVLHAFSFEGAKSLVDIGGGSGVFARAVVERWPHLAVTVADLPPVAELARRSLAEVGLERRIDVVGLDAATGSVPGTYDVASLIRIVHDHDDDKAMSIIRAAASALTPDGTLLLAEPIAARDAAGKLNDIYFHTYLLAMGSGRPRRFGELREMLKQAGLTRVRRHRSPVPLIASVLSASRENDA